VFTSVSTERYATKEEEVIKAQKSTSARPSSLYSVLRAVHVHCLYCGIPNSNSAAPWILKYSPTAKTLVASCLSRTGNWISN